MSFTRYVGALAGGALALSSALSLNAAYAQNYNAADAVSLSRFGSMPCGEFTRLGPGAQDDIVRRMVNAAPTQSLATQTGPTLESNGDVTGQSQDGSTVPRTPLDAGQLVAACQAASPDATLRSAFVQFNSSSMNDTVGE